MKIWIPNSLTFLRIALIPVTFWMLERGQPWTAVVLFGCLMLTDFLDGRLARLWKAESSLGALWDPIADKLVVMSFFLFFYLKGQLPFAVFVLIFFRDACQLSCVPILIQGLKISFKVKPIWISKLSTAVNLALLFFLLLSQPLKFLDEICVVLMMAAFALALVTSYRFVMRLFLIVRGVHDTFD